jgi:NAD(P)-dependent dehydrogenase (short-subunit alcohol dehydrogenase family)
MRSFANELGEFGIRVNTIHPTGVGSAGMGNDSSVAPLFGHSRYLPLAALNVLPDLDLALGDEFVPIPVLKPVEISHTVVFLASDDARYITGVTLPVDAGTSITP